MGGWVGIFMPPPLSKYNSIYRDEQPPRTFYNLIGGV